MISVVLMDVLQFQNPRNVAQPHPVLADLRLGGGGGWYSLNVRQAWVPLSDWIDYNGVEVLKR